MPTAPPTQTQYHMPVHDGLQDSSAYRNGFLSIGNFDGVHLGHQSILSRLVDQTRAAGTVSCVLTFEPHPLEILKPEIAPPPRLTTLEEKARLILKQGVDHVIVYPTDRDLLNSTASQFFQKIVMDHFASQGMVEGPNFFFGKDRSGTTDTLQTLCITHEISLDVVSPLREGKEMISSSAIRRLLAQGNVGAAAQKLGRRYSITGVVSEGEKRGRTLGFPTANLTNVETIIPEDGVYAAIIRNEEGAWVAAVNIGPNPTFDVKERKVEAHLIDFEDNLYGQTIQLDFVERIRDVATFSDVNELKQQVENDITKVKTIAREL